MVMDKMKGRVEEEAKKLAAKIVAQSNSSSSMKPLPPAPPGNLFSFIEDLRGSQSHPMRRAASFSFAEHPPTWGQPYPGSSAHLRYHEQPEYSYTPNTWSPHSKHYTSAKHVPPPPYGHSPTMSSFPYDPRLSSSVPYQPFQDHQPSPHDPYYATDSRHQVPSGTSSYSKRHGATAPSIVISSKPFLHSRYPSGYEYLRTSIGFYPYNPDPNVNGLAWLAKKGFETQGDIVVNFDDYDGFIRTQCPDARLLVPYQDIP
ncbi:hypothetical protein FSPOR_151 [Fusarium sporotrichioides]|uniref:Uncharacterized protein n=1 Tax=Fusarium sporotrichioides TaxID=5514 RepID=A0A395SW66_FUSSP|nr:hypothetical protein FSPOR_151 [Fusarium sporotrichioides]